MAIQLTVTGFPPGRENGYLGLRCAKPQELEATGTRTADDATSGDGDDQWLQPYPRLQWGEDIIPARKAEQLPARMHVIERTGAGGCCCPVDGGYVWDNQGDDEGAGAELTTIRQAGSACRRTVLDAAPFRMMPRCGMQAAAQRGFNGGRLSYCPNLDVHEDEGYWQCRWLCWLFSEHQPSLRKS